MYNTYLSYEPLLIVAITKEDTHFSAALVYPYVVSVYEIIEIKE
jgi:hypothetical protein